MVVYVGLISVTLRYQTEQDKLSNNILTAIGSTIFIHLYVIQLKCS